MQNEVLPASPNLDSLARNRPTCKRALIRLLWPKIRASLDMGHNAREVYDKLHLDGIEISYPSLCRYVAELRRSDGALGNCQTATPDWRRNGVRDDGGTVRARDPLANVRRLTEDRPPGFRYAGTMSEKELFGE